MTAPMSKIGQIVPVEPQAPVRLARFDAALLLLICP